MGGVQSHADNPEAPGLRPDPKVLGRLGLVNFVAPRGAVKCESAQRKRARADNSLAAAPVPLVAGMGGSYAASQKPLTPQSREVPSTGDV